MGLLERLLSGWKRSDGAGHVAAVRRHGRARRVPPLWLVHVPGRSMRQPLRIPAWTASEARAEAKRSLGGLRRLPVGSFARRKHAS